MSRAPSCTSRTSADRWSSTTRSSAPKSSRSTPRTRTPRTRLAILRIGHFTLMLHPQEPHAQEFTDTRVGVGIHLQLQVPDVDAFYNQCLEAGAMLSVSGEPTDQDWGWREFALRDPDGYVWSVYQDKSGGQWTA